jgi:hypothetical protein
MRFVPPKIRKLSGLFLISTVRMNYSDFWSRKMDKKKASNIALWLQTLSNTRVPLNWLFLLLVLRGWKMLELNT